MTGTTSHLLRLPLELREEIYELAILADAQDDNHEVDVESACKPRSMLSLVSKQMHEEAASVIDRKKGWPCRHIKYTFTLWDPCEDIYEACKPLSHKLTNASRLRRVGRNDGSGDSASVGPIFKAHHNGLTFSYDGIDAARCADLAPRVWDVPDDHSEEYSVKAKKGKALQKLVYRFRTALHRVWSTRGE